MEHTWPTVQRIGEAFLVVFQVLFNIVKWLFRFLIVLIVLVAVFKIAGIFLAFLWGIFFGRGHEHDC